MTDTTRAQKWNAETSAHPFAKNDRWAIVFDPTPGGIDNGDGTRTFSLRFPALFLSEYVDDPEQAAKDIAQALNEYEPGLLARAEAAERERDEARAMVAVLAPGQAPNPRACADALAAMLAEAEAKGRREAEAEIERLRNVLTDALDAWETHCESGDGMQGHWSSDARAAMTGEDG